MNPVCLKSFEENEAGKAEGQYGNLEFYLFMVESHTKCMNAFPFPPQQKIGLWSRILSFISHIAHLRNIKGEILDYRIYFYILLTFLLPWF